MPLAAIDLLFLGGAVLIALAIAGAVADYWDRREARQQHIRDRMATYCSRQP